MFLAEIKFDSCLRRNGNGPIANTPPDPSQIVFISDNHS